MKIGFIGAGNVAQTIAKHVLPHGHEVVLSNSKGPESLAALIKELGPGAKAGTALEATEQDIIVLAVGWLDAQKVLSVIPSWKNKILIDTTNRIASANPLALGDISGRTSSEIISDLTPGAKVIKAFNTVPMMWITDYSPNKERTVFCVSGDDAEAKKLVCDLIDQIGFASIDLGTLAAGGIPQQLGGSLNGVKLNFVERFVIKGLTTGEIK